jgi:hypothetical protein
LACWLELSRISRPASLMSASLCPASLMSASLCPASLTHLSESRNELNQTGSEDRRGAVPGERGDWLLRQHLIPRGMAVARPEPEICRALPSSRNVEAKQVALRNYCSDLDHGPRTCSRAAESSIASSREMPSCCAVARGCSSSRMKRGRLPTA